jgi:Cytochrome b5-like Heme/Steroid binding domain
LKVEPQRTATVPLAEKAFTEQANAFQTCLYLSFHLSPVTIIYPSLQPWSQPKPFNSSTHTLQHLFCYPCTCKASRIAMSGFFNSGAKKADLPIYTKEEVAMHKGPEDIWIIVNGNIYNFSKFQYRHPGGRHCESLLSLHFQL